MVEPIIRSEISEKMVKYLFSYHFQQPLSLAVISSLFHEFRVAYLVTEMCVFVASSINTVLHS